MSVRARPGRGKKKRYSFIRHGNRVWNGGKEERVHFEIMKHKKQGKQDLEREKFTRVDLERKIQI